jgi:crossover junction endodeoxyribonuclease RusA
VSAPNPFRTDASRSAAEIRDQARAELGRLLAERSARHAARLAVWVPGQPATQGSKDYLSSRYGRESNLRLPGWRSDVREGLLNADGQPLRTFDGPVSAGLLFVLARPARPTRCPHCPCGRPDLDKLTRAVLDAATSAGVLADDARVVSFHELRKTWTNPEDPRRRTAGCWVEFVEVGT